MMLWIILSIALGSGGVAREQVDLIELNHKCSENECLQFDQVIIWRWSPEYRRYNVQHWFLVSALPGYPVKAGEFYQCYGCYLDNKKVLFRSKMFRETYTHNDPERDNLKLFPIEMRNRGR